MHGILWAVIGTSIGLLGPLLVMAWRRRAATPLPPRAAGKAPGRPATRSPAQSQVQTRPAGGMKRKLALKFHGVSLKPGPQACQAVQALAGQRFLPAEAPAMPLAACDQQKCQCAFTHHRDRRDQDDRRSGWGTFGGFAPTLAEGNRRGKSRDRRSRA